MSCRKIGQLLQDSFWTQSKRHRNHGELTSVCGREAGDALLVSVVVHYSYGVEIMTEFLLSVTL